MPDRGKRGKDIAILQMGQDACRKISEHMNCVTWVTIKLFCTLRSGGGTKPSPPTHHSIRADPDAGYAQCFLDLGQSTRDGRTVDAAVTMVAAASVTMLNLI
jgi:hypothetical protein